MPSDFAALAGELADLQKSMSMENDPKAKNTPAMGKKGMRKGGMGDKSDAKVKEAAGDCNDDEEDMQKSDDDMDDGEMMGKSLEITLADGSKVSAIDASDMLKALQDETNVLRSQMDDMQKAFVAIVGTVKGILNTTGQHGTLLKALNSAPSQGSGRRTMVSIAEKLVAPVAGAPPEKATVNAQQVMMKAQVMCREGKLDWSVMPFIEAHQGRGALAPPDLLRRFPELLIPLS